MINSTQYDEYITENLFTNDKTAFEKAKDDTTLLQMFGGLQSVINQWYSAQRQGNIGKYKNVKDYIAACNLQAAQIAAMAIVDTNLILQNQKLVLQIYLAHYYDENSPPPDSSVLAQLTSIAYQTVAQGGEAVYIARAMLGIDVVDILPIGLRKASSVKENMQDAAMLTLHPNPAKSKCIAVFSCNANYILIEDQLGKQLKTYTLTNDEHNFTIDLNIFNEGIYVVKLVADDKVIAVQKLVVIK